MNGTAGPGDFGPTPEHGHANIQDVAEFLGVRMEPHSGLWTPEGKMDYRRLRLVSGWTLVVGFGAALLATLIAAFRAEPPLTFAFEPPPAWRDTDILWGVAGISLLLGLPLLAARLRTRIGVLGLTGAALVYVGGLVGWILLWSHPGLGARVDYLGAALFGVDVIGDLLLGIAIVRGIGRVAPVWPGLVVIAVSVLATGSGMISVLPGVPSGPHLHSTIFTVSDLLYSVSLALLLFAALGWLGYQAVAMRGGARGTWLGLVLIASGLLAVLRPDWMSMVSDLLPALAVLFFVALVLQELAPLLLVGALGLLIYQSVARRGTETSVWPGYAMIVASVLIIVSPQIAGEVAANSGELGLLPSALSVVLFYVAQALVALAVLLDTGALAWLGYLMATEQNIDSGGSPASAS